MARMKDNWEDIMIKNVPQAITEIKQKMTTELEESKNIGIGENTKNTNATQIPPNSFEQTTNISNVSENGQGMENNAQAKTLVRKPNGPVPKVINTNQEQPNNNQTPNYSGAAEGYNNSQGSDYFDSIRNGGSINASTILIIIASFVIVAMLILIALTVLDGFGIRFW